MPSSADRSVSRRGGPAHPSPMRVEAKKHNIAHREAAAEKPKSLEILILEATGVLVEKAFLKMVVLV